MQKSLPVIVSFLTLSGYQTCRQIAYFAKRINQQEIRLPIHILLSFTVWFPQH